MAADPPAGPHGPAAGQEDFAGVPDAFDRLWTPHRMAYIKGEGKPTGPDAGEGCPFCVVPTMSDEDGLIVARGTLVYAVLNLYPYTSEPRATIRPSSSLSVGARQNGQPSSSPGPDGLPSPLM